MGNYLASCQDLATTEGQVERAGLSVGDVVTSPVDGLSFDESWIVVWQEPLPGTMVPIGSDIVLTVEDPTAKC